MSKPHGYAALLLASASFLLGAPARAAGTEGPVPARTPVDEVTARPAEGRSAGGVIERLPMTKEGASIFKIREDTRLQVEDLVKRMAGLPDGPALRALQGKVQELKQDCRLRVLRTKADFARQRGDLRAAGEVDNLIEQILHPRPAPSTTVQRQPPDGSVEREVSRP
jgi:hypothetical protein